MLCALLWWLILVYIVYSTLLAFLLPDSSVCWWPIELQIGMKQVGALPVRHLLTAMFLLECLFVCKITQKLWTDFYGILCMGGKSRLGFGGIQLQFGCMIWNWNVWALRGRFVFSLNAFVFFVGDVFVLMNVHSLWFVSAWAVVHLFGLQCG